MLRVAIATAASGLAQVALFVRLGGSSGGSFLPLVFIVLATLGAGWFARRATALAGAASVALAAASYTTLTLLGPAGTGLSSGDFLGTVLGVVATFWPYIGIGAVAGALGGALHGRVLSAARR